MMNKLILIVLVVVVSCGKNPGDTENAANVSIMEREMNTVAYPEMFNKVLEAHGGLDRWRAQQTLSFEIPDSAHTATHTIALSSRMDKISMGNVEIGYDGKAVWLLDKQSTYQSNPVFMHNLMFYFYAMPFVLADSGIKYDTTEDLKIDNKTYPGIKITFDSGVGSSPGDEYYLHYDPETYKMTWLGYRATFDGNKQPEQPNWINYDDWEAVDGILLPKAITWHAVKDGVIKEAKNTVNFENVSLSETAKSVTFFAKPEGALFVNAKQ